MLHYTEKKGFKLFIEKECDEWGYYIEDSDGEIAGCTDYQKEWTRDDAIDEGENELKRVVKEYESKANPVMTADEMWGAWSDDSSREEFLKWFLNESPDKVMTASEMKSSLEERFDDDGIEFTDEIVDSALMAMMEAVFKLSTEGKKYEIIPNFDYIQWHGKLSNDFTLGKA